MQGPVGGGTRLIHTPLSRPAHRRPAAAETWPSASSGGTVPGLWSENPAQVRLAVACKDHVLGL